jgi:hypothetical protein
MLIGTAPMQLYFSQLVFINWLQSHLIRCPFKYVTGIDCPGCGFQRSVLALVQGNLHESFTLYPPTIPLLLVLAYYLAGRVLKWNGEKFVSKRMLVIAMAAIVIFNYGVKLWALYHNYKISA